MAMLEVKDLQVYYGMIQAIKGISLEVNQGEVIALIGQTARERRRRCIQLQVTISRRADRKLLEGKDITKTKLRLIRSSLWGWRMYTRKEEECSQN